MKQSALIKGLIVFSIIDGKEIARVKDILINAQKKTVDYLVVGNPKWLLGPHVIAFQDILGIGDDAVMIDNEGDINNIEDIPEAVALLEAGIGLIDARVLTNKGNIIGTVTEVIVDENSGRVDACEYNNTENKKAVIPAIQIVTFGKDALIVNIVANTGTEAVAQKPETAPDIIEDKSELPKPDTAAPEQTTLSEPAAGDTIPESSIKGINEEAKIETAEISPASTITDEQDETDTLVEPAPTEPLSAAQLFAQKQKEYLIGKTANKTITDSAGNVLINKGDVLTSEMVDKVTQAGKFRELVLNV